MYLSIAASFSLLNFFMSRIKAAIGLIKYFLVFSLHRFCFAQAKNFFVRKGQFCNITF